MSKATVLAILAAAVALPAAAKGPSFDCKKVKPDSIEGRVCKSDELSALDVKLSEAYAAAHKKAKDRKTLTAEQRGWVKGRNDCWKDSDVNNCVRSAYVFRIAELQATYALVKAMPPATYACPGGDIHATYYETDPPSLIAKRGAKSSLMFAQPSGSGAKYQGQNESLWEHQGEARVTWGPGAAEITCRTK